MGKLHLSEPDNPDAMAISRAEALMSLSSGTIPPITMEAPTFSICMAADLRCRRNGPCPHALRKASASTAATLMTYVYQARSVAVQTLDEDLDRCLRTVEEASIDIS
jgi:hypothetical protein